MLHRLSTNFLTWPDWIKMLLLIALTSLAMTVTILGINFVIENIR